MKTLLWLVGLIILLSGCKREEPAPGLTEINMTVVDEMRKPVPNVEVLVAGRRGSYFGGNWRDTTFAYRYTNANGTISYKLLIEREWRVYAMPFSPYDSAGRAIYDVSKFEGTVDAIVNVGQVNNITVIMRKR